MTQKGDGVLKIADVFDRVDKVKLDFIMLTKKRDELKKKLEELGDQQELREVEEIVAKDIKKLNKIVLEVTSILSRMEE